MKLAKKTTTNCLSITWLRHRKTAKKIYVNINTEAKAIANNYEIAERVDCLPMTDAFITLKDHKPNFTTNPKSRLINPSKSELGKVSIFLIEKVNTIIRDKSLVNQWRDTDTVINYLKISIIKASAFSCNLTSKNFTLQFPKVFSWKQ